jgi:HK97 gp10 family phage protein
MQLQGIDRMLAEIRGKLQNASDRVERRALKAAGEPIAEAMRARVNLSNYEYSAHIKDDIKVSRVIRKDGVKYVLIGPGKKTGWRAKFLEFGTSKMPAQPFAEPSFKEKRDEALQKMADEFEKGLRS